MQNFQSSKMAQLENIENQQKFLQRQVLTSRTKFHRKLDKKKSVNNYDVRTAFFSKFRGNMDSPKEA